MGWRFRKRIKILPGVRINLSKSGISTTVGVRGASVTFGPNGTYVNTGIPGTGIYSRERISRRSGSRQPMYVGNNFSAYTSNSSGEIYPQKPTYFLVSSQGIRIPVFKRNYYIAYLIAIIIPLLGLFQYLYGWWMIACCILTGLIHLVCWAFLYDKVDYTSNKASFAFQWINEDFEEKAKHLVRGHQLRIALSSIIALFSLYPFFAMNYGFMSLFNPWPKTYEGGVIVTIITIIVVFLWVASLCQEYDMLKKLKVLIIPFSTRADRSRDEDMNLAFNDIKIGESIAKHNIVDWKLTDEYKNYKSFSVLRTIIVDGKEYQCDCIVNCIDDIVGSLEVIIEDNITKDLYPLYITKYGVPNGKEIKDFDSPFSKAWNYSKQQIAFQYGIFERIEGEQKTQFKQIRLTYLDRQCFAMIKQLSEERKSKEEEEKNKEREEQLRVAEIEKEQKIREDEEIRLQKIKQRQKESQQI